MFRKSPLQQYGQVKHNAYAEFASAHEKTLMLFDGAITFLGVAQQAIIRSDYELKGKKISQTIAVVNGLKDCLDLSQGELPKNLRDVYEYVVEQLLNANFTSDGKAIEEVQSLLKTIRDSWAHIPPDMHNVTSKKSHKK
jgi:flagellar protein FliS